MHLVTITAFFSLAFKPTSSLSSAEGLSSGHAVLGKSVIPFQQVRQQVYTSKPATQLITSDLEGYRGSDYDPVDLKAKIHCILKKKVSHKWQSCAWILNQESMQDMAALQFVSIYFKKLHTRVSQDTNESVDKSFSFHFFTELKPER